MANKTILKNVMIIIRIQEMVVLHHVRLNLLGLVILLSLLYALNLQLVEIINLIQMNNVMTQTKIQMMDAHQLAN